MSVAAATTTAAILIPTISPSHALAPPQAAQDYDRYALGYDALDGGSAARGLGLEAARQSLIGQARGRVLEVGVGTGLNVPYYNVGQVTSLTLVDISAEMLRQAERKVQDVLSLSSSNHKIPVRLIQADATSLHFADDLTQQQQQYFDTVIDSFSLCVMGNDGARQCLQQMARAVQPDTGRLLLLENTKSSNVALGWYQDVTATAAASLGGKGCVYNQDVRQMILDTEPQLEIVSEQAYAAGVFRAYVVRRKL